jgi:hypothetical protein
MIPDPDPQLHCPFWQVAVPPHTIPHDPQLPVSVVVFTHVPLQVDGYADGHTHALL